MNTIMMTTYLAGAIMGQASFGSMEKCKTAAEEVMTQEINGLSVVCTYQQVFFLPAEARSIVRVCPGPPLSRPLPFVLLGFVHSTVCGPKK